MRPALAALGFAVVAAAIGDAPTARASDDGPSSASPPVASADAQAPAVRYAALDRAACEAELTRRGATFETVAEAAGVLAPVRLRAPLHGVTFRSPLPEAKRATSSLEILDCRLALALDDFAAILTRHDVVEVVHLSMYRAPRARKGHPWPAGKLATRHGGALAIDAAIFRRKDGSELRVDRDFHGRIGARPCGARATAPRPATPEATELRAIACEAADAQLFNVELTPDFNRKHRNHFHLEVTPDVRWFWLR